MNNSTMSVKEAAARLGIGSGTAYESIKRGHFPLRIIRVGKLIRIPVAEVQAALGIPVDLAS